MGGILVEKDDLELSLFIGSFFGEKITCTGKVKYLDEDTVKRVILTYPKRDYPLTYYPCYWCGNWHIGRRLSGYERKAFKEQMEERKYQRY